MAGIGEKIAELRKKKGLTQEELGKMLGVSMQAVSRWENGGMPDPALLPALADAFQVSIDVLFGRTGGEVQLESALLKRISGLPAEQRHAEVYRLCWEMERAMCGSDEYHNGEEFRRCMQSGPAHSRVDFDSGITEMKVGNKERWFFVSPEPAQGRCDFLYNREAHTKLFKLLSEPDAYDALFLIMKRDWNPFTARLLERNLNLPQGRAVEILRAFEEFGLVKRSALELDDEQITVYNICSDVPYLFPFLTFAQEIIQHPKSFNYQHSMRHNPYLHQPKSEEKA